MSKVLTIFMGLAFISSCGKTVLDEQDTPASSFSYSELPREAVVYKGDIAVSGSTEITVDSKNYFNTVVSSGYKFYKESGPEFLIVDELTGVVSGVADIGGEYEVVIKAVSTSLSASSTRAGQSLSLIHISEPTRRS